MITLIDATDTTLTVSWPSIENSKRYVLQYRKSNAESSFELLSDKLQSTLARKRNLTDTDNVGFVFRVRGVINDNNNNIDEKDWISHTEPFYLLSVTDEKERMEAPTVTLGGSNASLLVSWKAYDGATAYEIQMRENQGGVSWTTIAESFKNTEVRKKNLTSDLGYQFLVRPVFGTPGTIAFSTPSETAVALQLSNGLKQLFNTLSGGSLVRNGGKEKVPLSDALGGKEFVLLYASAHWCGPCRQYTPQLVQWYQGLNQYKTVEIIFLSADHDESSFQKYFASMPWLAVDYDDPIREQLMAMIKVTGIPRLAVLDGRTGTIIEDNAVGKSLDLSRWRSLVGRKN